MILIRKCLFFVHIYSCINSYYRVSIFEKIILILGIFQFLAVGKLNHFSAKIIPKSISQFPGGLVLAAIDQIPYQLLNYAISMGVLSFFVAVLFVIDLGNGAPKRPFTQAHSVVLIEKPDKEKGNKTEEVIINTEAKNTNNYIDQRSNVNETQIFQTPHDAIVQPPVFARTKSYAERRNVGDTHIKRRSMENLTQLRDSEEANIHYLGNRSRSNTYIQEPKIDQESYPYQTSVAEPRMNVIRFYYPQHQHARQIYLRQATSNEDLPTMVTPGYVKNTAKQWEQRVSGVKHNKNFPPLDTIV